MLSIEKNFLFIHPPKTGGTSVKDILKKYQTPGVAGAYHSEFFDELEENNWQTLSEVYNKKIEEGDKSVIDKLTRHSKPITEHDKYVTYNKTLSSYLSSDFHFTYNQYKNVIRPDIFESLTKFGIVRNPFDRIISLHLWQDGEFNRDILISKIKKYAFLLYNDWNPCYYYLSELVPSKFDKEDGEKWNNAGFSVDTNIEFGDSVDFFLKFELHLNNETLSGLCRDLRIEKSSLRHLNKTKPRKHYSHYYDNELIDIVAKVYDTDIIAFNYQFEDKR
jgi:hypothetical protein